MQKGLCIFLVLISGGIATASELVVDIKAIPPMVAKDKDTFSGFSVELWQAISQKLGSGYKFQEVPLQQMFTDLQEGKADVAIAAITITSEREKLVDFSHPMLDSGLRIAVPRTDGSGLSSFRILFRARLLKTLLYFLLFIVLCGHLLWYAERGKEAINDKYFPGIFEAFWCVLATMTTVGYGDIAPKKWLGRLAAMFVMLTGIGFFGFILAQLTAEVTEQTLFTISSQRDLRDKDVATVKDTTSVKELQKLGANVIETETIESMQSNLLDGTVDAIVYDSPNILDFARHEQEKVVVVGDIFARQYYGIAVQKGSPLRNSINQALLELREDGTFETIHAKYFGT